MPGSVMRVAKRLIAILRFAGTVRLRQQILLSVQRSKSQITATGFMPRVRSDSEADGKSLFMPVIRLLT